jgi:hypothetical protein
MPEGNDTKQHSAGQSPAKSPITVRSRLVTAATAEAWPATTSGPTVPRRFVDQFPDIWKIAFAARASGYPDAATCAFARGECVPNRAETAAHSELIKIKKAD